MCPEVGSTVLVADKHGSVRGGPLRSLELDGDNAVLEVGLRGLVPLARPQVETLMLHMLEDSVRFAKPTGGFSRFSLYSAAFEDPEKRLHTWCATKKKVFQEYEVDKECEDENKLRAPACKFFGRHPVGTTSTLCLHSFEESEQMGSSIFLYTEKQFLQVSKLSAEGIAKFPNRHGDRSIEGLINEGNFVLDDEQKHQWCATNAQLKTQDLPQEYIEAPRCEQGQPHVPRCQYVGDDLYGASITRFMCLRSGDEIVMLKSSDVTKQHGSIVEAISKAGDNHFTIKAQDQSFFLTVSARYKLAFPTLRQGSEAGLLLNSWCVEESDDNFWD
eukprot:gnl/TRDRNA2_/TRDRNA2_32776_c1_seq1.p1 gnl/TRDRNA2_/TRDRNA2_32776_c1~~gnl/TRDRNA2_/TRDRNA2_32776_c1_seq1.p1  ORF type:complete len:330 (+),score=39.57 gnl/TRDRNA2_/TRDRNA2_32776_c1_seq1:1-990(+)